MARRVGGSPGWIRPARSHLGRLVGGLALVLVGVACTAAPPPPVGPGDKYQGTELGGDPAPDFRLTDQRGESLALSDLRGKVVALTFMDSRCAEVCPLTTIELRHAALLLGPAAVEQTAFIAVNINDRANRPEDVARFTQENKLDQLANWHFLTGAPPQLAAVARDYYIYAVRGRGDDVEHNTGIYIIDRQGRRQVYLDVPPELAVETRPADILARQMRRFLG